LHIKLSVFYMYVHAYLMQNTCNMQMA